MSSKAKQRSVTPKAESPADTGDNQRGSGDQTDVHALDDAVGIAGVDLNAEEEAIRASNYAPRNQQQQNAARARVRPQLILDEQAVKEVVLKIAASYHLKNLESDSLPLISLAVQARMSALIEQMLAAKHYRTSANHLRPPPMLPVQYEGEVPTPMWDQVLHDDNEKILTTFDRVEREEERQARKSRLLRDQLEQAEKERLERLAEEGDDGGGDVSMKVEGGSGSVPGTPAAGGSGKGEPGKKEKKRKRETATQAARNMTEDVRKRLSDATASKKLGTKKFSWLASGTGLGGADSPSMRKKARIPPLPPSSLSISMTSLPTLGTSLQDGLDQPPLTAMERLAGVPAAHDASQIGSQDDPANRLVTIRDALFVMDQERGKGAGTGSGTRPTVRAMLGRV